METTIKERPILFSTPMVLSILSKIKRMTRRTKGLERMNETPDSWSPYVGDYRIDKQGRFCQKFFMRRGFSEHATCPYGKPGDRLWVREAWGKCNEKLVYAASVCSPKYDKPKYGWKPSIHMPRVASRILLEITDIRVERLQAITEEDAIAEGIEDLKGGYYRNYRDISNPTISPIISFKSLWININGYDKYNESWLQNPWVWVVSFKVLEVKK